jgi:hypothetical protein
MPHLPHSAVNPSPGERHPAEELMEAIDALLDFVSTLRAGSDRLEGERRQRFDELEQRVDRKARQCNLQTLLPPPCSWGYSSPNMIHLPGSLTNLPVINDQMAGFAPFMLDNWKRALLTLKTDAAEQLAAETPPARETEGSGHGGDTGRGQADERARRLQRDGEIYAAWQRAHTAGVEKKDFAEQLRMPLKDLNLRLNRHAKWRRRRGLT